MSKGNRLVKLRYVAKNEEDSEKILKAIALYFPKANLELEIDRKDDETQQQHKSDLENLAVAKANEAIEANLENEKVTDSSVQVKKWNFKEFLLKLTEASSIAACAEAVKTWIGK